MNFNSIPSNIRVPWTYIEFDNSNASSGAATLTHKMLILGQKLSSGTAVANEIVRVTSVAEAKTLFGAGSMLALMADTLFKNNSFTEAYFCPQDEPGAGVAASGTITYTATDALAGTIYLYIGGKQITAGVTAAMTATQVATAVKDAINADTDLPVTAANTAGVVTITCKWKGLTGNKINIRHNYNRGEALPSGVGATIVAMASGTAAPTLTAAIAAMGDTHYTEVCLPYNDATSTTAITTEGDLRWGPLVQKEFFAYAAEDDTLGNLGTLGNSLNTPFISIMHCRKSPTPPFQVAAAVTGAVAYSSGVDPAVPLKTIKLVGVMAPAEADRFTLAERNSLLFDGISTFTVGADGSVYIELLITTYKTNAAGADDISYMGVERLQTLRYLRYDLRNFILAKYPRHKLGDDSKTYGAGQKVMTPKTMRAELIARFLLWQELALVEDITGFIAGLIVERNSSNPDRLDIHIEPNIINQFLVSAVQIAFKN